MNVNEVERNLSEQIDRKKMHALLVFVMICLILIIHLTFSRQVSTTLKPETLKPADTTLRHSLPANKRNSPHPEAKSEVKLPT